MKMRIKRRPRLLLQQRLRIKRQAPALPPSKRRRWKALKEVRTEGRITRDQTTTPEEITTTATIRETDNKTTTEETETGSTTTIEEIEESLPKETTTHRKVNKKESISLGSTRTEMRENKRESLLNLILRIDIPEQDSQHFRKTNSEKEVVEEVTTEQSKTN